MTDQLVFADGLAQGHFSSLHPFRFLANVSEIIGLTVAVRPSTTVMSVKENEGNPLYSLWNDQLCEAVLSETGH